MYILHSTPERDNSAGVRLGSGGPKNKGAKVLTLWSESGPRRRRRVSSSCPSGSDCGKQARNQSQSGPRHELIKETIPPSGSDGNKKEGARGRSLVGWTPRPSPARLISPRILRRGRRHPRPLAPLLLHFLISKCRIQLAQRTER